MAISDPSKAYKNVEKFVLSALKSLITSIIAPVTIVKELDER